MGRYCADDSRAATDTTDKTNAFRTPVLGIIAIRQAVGVGPPNGFPSARRWVQALILHRQGLASGRKVGERTPKVPWSGRQV